MTLDMRAYVAVLSSYTFSFNSKRSSKLERPAGRCCDWWASSHFACLQDLSQTRARWTGVAADGLFSLFGTKVLLPGLGWSLGLAHMLVR